MREQTKRVCFVLPALGLGGAENQLRQYLKLAPESIEASIVYLNKEYDETSSSLLPQMRELGVQVFCVPLRPPKCAFLLSLTKTLKFIHPDMVHTMLRGSSSTWGRLAALLAGVPIIMQSDRSLNPPLSFGQRVANKWLDKRTSRLFTNAWAVAHWLESTGVPRSKLVVIPNGVDTEHFVPLKNPKNPKTVAGFLGKFRPAKRLDILLDAVLSLDEKDRPDRLILAGDGPLVPWVKDRLGSNAWLSEHCELSGLVHDVTEFFAKVDYLVLSSEREGMPNVILEAMAMGKPVVSTDVSDVGDMIDGAGFLAEPCNALSLGDAIRRMQGLTFSERDVMGRRAREKAMTHWALPVIAERFWDAHLEALG